MEEATMTSDGVLLPTLRGMYILQDTPPALQVLTPPAFSLFSVDLLMHSSLNLTPPVTANGPHTMEKRGRMLLTALPPMLREMYIWQDTLPALPVSPPAAFRILPEEDLMAT